MKLVPLGDKIVLKQLEAEETIEERDNFLETVNRRSITGV